MKGKTMVIDKIRKVNVTENSVNSKASDMMVGKWIKCDNCKEILYKDDVKNNLSVLSSYVSDDVLLFYKLHMSLMQNDVSPFRLTVSNGVKKLNVKTYFNNTAPNLPISNQLYSNLGFSI